MASNLAQETYWTDKSYYHDAEKRYYENLAQLPKQGQFPAGTNIVTPAQKTKEKNVEIRPLVDEKVATKTACPIWTMTPTLSHDLSLDKFWTDSAYYNDAERVYFEKLAKGGGSGVHKSTLASEVAKAREHIKTSLQSVAGLTPPPGAAGDSAVLKTLTAIQDMVQCLEKRVAALEIKCASCCPPTAVAPRKTAPAPAKSAPPKPDDDDVDLFGSESEEEDGEAAKLKEQRLAEYAAKKSKKPVLIAKSSIILDVKPWDDETDMGVLEQKVRAIEMDGLLWGASKLVPVGYGIKKLQITCVVEDEKVSVDLLQEKIEENEDVVQSVDIAAFNKI